MPRCFSDGHFGAPVSYNLSSLVPATKLTTRKETPSPDTPSETLLSRRQAVFLGQHRRASRLLCLDCLSWTNGSTLTIYLYSFYIVFSSDLLAFLPHVYQLLLCHATKLNTGLYLCECFPIPQCFYPWVFQSQSPDVYMKS
jgi:hypothetical protein